MSVLSHIFPDDIVNIISSFNPEHREKMSPVLRSIFLSEVPIKGVFSRLEYIRNYCTDIKKCIDDPEYICKILSKCRCCERHMSCRPKHFEDNPDLIHLKSKKLNFNLDEEFEEYNSCSCRCRHDSRFIIRYCNPNYNEPDLSHTYEYFYEYTYDYSYH